MQYLRVLDFFAMQPSFFYHSKPRIKTFLGTIISLIITIYTVCLGIYFGMELFQKKQASIDAYKDYGNLENKMLNVSNFLIAFVFEGANKDIINVTSGDVFKVIFENEKSKDEKSEKSIQSQVSLIPCSEEFFKKFPNEYNNTITNIMNNGFCVDFNNSELYNSPIYNLAYSDILFTIKFNSSYYDGLDYEYFERLLPIRMKVFYQSINYKADDLDEPFTLDLGRCEFEIAPSYQQGYNLIFLESISRRDEELFLTRISQKKSYGFSQLLESHFFYFRSWTEGDDENNAMLDMINLRFNFEPYTMIYTRRYTKIQELLSQLVSFFNIGFAIGQFIINFFASQEVTNLISYSYFSKRTAEKHSLDLANWKKKKEEVSHFNSSFLPITSENQIKTSQIGTLQTMNAKFFAGKLEKRDNELKENDPKEDELKEYELKEKEPKEKEPKENEQKEIKLNFAGKPKKKEFKFNFFFCMWRKKIYVEKRKVIEILEIGNLLKYYEDLRKLKFVTLNSSQVYFFNKIERFNFLGKESQISFEAKEDPTKYFKKKIYQGKLNDIDKKLIELMEEKEKDKYL